MSNKLQTSDEQYEGPSKAVEVLGRSNAFGWAGSLIGLLGGGFAAAITNKESGERSQALTKWLAGHNIHIGGRTAIIVVSALGSSQACHWIGAAIGARFGLKKAGKGQEQFKRLKQEHDAVKAELEVVKSELDAEHKETSKAVQEPLDYTADRRETAPSHHIRQGVVEAEKEVPAQLAR